METDPKRKTQFRNSLGEEEMVPNESGKGAGSRASQVSLDLIIIKEKKIIVETGGADR